MPKYRVTTVGTFTGYVEAEDEQEANFLAQETVLDWDTWFETDVIVEEDED